MCHPYNSSTRRNELKEVFGSIEKGYGPAAEAKPMSYREWNDTVNDILENINLVAYMNITGGEPLQHNLDDFCKSIKEMEKIRDESIVAIQKELSKQNLTIRESRQT